MKLKAICFLGLFISLAILSDMSQYQIPNLSTVALDDIIFLTPYGILKNLIIGKTEIYFHSPPSRYSQLGIHLLCYIPVFITSWLILFPRGKK
jgi:hypothetical protein